MSWCSLVRPAVVIALLMGSPLVAAAAPLVVPTDFPTIQSAVDAAPDGARVKVLAGVYPEQLTISRDITIEGAGAAASFVEAPPTKKLKSFRKDGDGDQLAAIIRIAGKARVRISDLGVRGPLPGICERAKMVGIGISVEEGAELRLERSTVSRISDDPVGDCLMFGIIVGFPGEAVGHIRLRQSSIEESQGPSVVVTGPFDGSDVSTGEISDSSVVGLGRPGNFDQNGITILGGAVATVSRNRVERLVCVREDLNCGLDPINQFQAFGIGVFAATRPGTLVEDNYLEKNDVGIYLAAIRDCCSVRNLATDNRLYGIIVQDGKNEIRDNDIRRGKVGIAVVAGEANAKAVLHGNEITQPSSKAIKEISCCGFTARAVVRAANGDSLARSGSRPARARLTSPRAPWYVRYLSD